MLCYAMLLKAGASPNPKHVQQATMADGTRCVVGHSALLAATDRKSTRLNSSHLVISYAVFCLKKKKHEVNRTTT